MLRLKVLLAKYIRMTHTLMYYTLLYSLLSENEPYYSEKEASEAVLDSAMVRIKGS